MQEFGLFSNFDGIGFVSHDGDLIANDCRYGHGHRMVLQEIKDCINPELLLSKEEGICK